MENTTTTFYVTTPIYYVSDKAHIGHAYTTIAADVLARYFRGKLDPEKVFFLTGTDEHGTKVAEAAKKAGEEPQVFVDRLAQTYKDLFQTLQISNDYFIRTTEDGHRKYAQEFIQALFDAGTIYQGEYEGLYCVGCEKYLTDSDLVDGRCPDHPNLEPVRQKEQNYFFKLSEWAPKIKMLIESDQLAILPAFRKNEILSRLSEDVRDISISRAQVSWGIPVPWDQTQTIYVWFEALLNYVSALEITDKEELWPPTVQLLGKEILWFHAVIWPAMLLAAGKSLPKTLFAHGWFTVNGQKMSKTVGNVIDPQALIARYGADAVRYFLLTATTFGSDGDISEERFAAQYQADLSNQLGNLLQRTLTLSRKFVSTDSSTGQSSTGEIDTLTEACAFDRALKQIWDRISEANQRLDQDAPWNETDSAKRKETLVAIRQELRTIALALTPYLPETAEKIIAQLDGAPITPLFPRLG